MPPLFPRPLPQSDTKSSWEKNKNKTKTPAQKETSFSILLLPMGAGVRGHEGVLGAPSQLWLCPGSCVDSARSRSRSSLRPQRRTRRACVRPGTKYSPELSSHRHVCSRAEPAILTSQPPVRVRDCPRLVDVKALESYKGSLFSCLVSPAINPPHSPMLLKEKRGQKMRWWPPRSTAGSRPPSLPGQGALGVLTGRLYHL